MEMRKFFVAFMLVGAFVVAMIMFGSQFGSDNEASVNIINDTRVSGVYSSLNDTFITDGGTQKTANDSFNDFTEEDLSITGFITDLFFKAIGNVGKSIMGIGNEIFNAVWQPILSMIGLKGDMITFVGSIVTTILLMSIVLLAWSLYKQGR